MGVLFVCVLRRILALDLSYIRLGKAKKHQNLEKSNILNWCKRNPIDHKAKKKSSHKRIEPFESQIHFKLISIYTVDSTEAAVRTPLGSIYIHDSFDNSHSSLKYTNAEG